MTNKHQKKAHGSHAATPKHAASAPVAQEVEPVPEPEKPADKTLMQRIFS